MNMGGGRKKRFKRLRWLLEYLLSMAMLVFVRLLPFRLALGLGGFLGILAYGIDKRHQVVTLDNLRDSFKDKTGEEIRFIARAVYWNLGYSVAEFIKAGRYGRRPPSEHFDFVYYD